MPDVFFSYSRRDTDFVRKLARSVSDRDKEVWLDTEGIADGEVFPDALRHAIEQSDTFLFVISPDSVISTYCEAEIKHAVSLNKRILPVLRLPVPDEEIPADVRFRNWIPFTDDSTYDNSMERLGVALDADLAQTRAHTKWLLKALEWDGDTRDNSLLLRGAELRNAEGWLSSADEHADPAPTTLQRDYVAASRQSSARRQRFVVGGSVFVAIVSIALLVFALISRGQATTDRATAQNQATSSRAQALTAESQAQLGNDPALSVMLAERAVRTKSTPDALSALRTALDASPFLRALPTEALDSIAGPGGTAPAAAVTAGLSGTFSPNGQQIATAAVTGSARILSTATGKVLQRAKIDVEPTALVWSPDGRSVLIGTTAGLQILDASTLLRSRAFPISRVQSMVFSADGGKLAVLGDTGVTVYDYPTMSGRTLHLTGSQDVYVGGGSGNMAFTPDGRTLIAGAADGPAVLVFDLAANTMQRHLLTTQAQAAVANYPLQMALSPDGSRLAAGYVLEGTGASRVSVFDTADWKLLVELTDEKQQIDTLQFSPDGGRVAVGGADGTGGVWSTTGGKVTSYLGQNAGLGTVAFDADGQTVLTLANDGTGRLWRSSGPEQSMLSVPSVIWASALGADTTTNLESPVGDVMGSTLHIVQRRSSTGAQISTLDVSGSVLGLAGTALSLDGRYAFVGGPQPTSPSSLWDIQQGRKVREFTIASLTAPQFSPDDRYVVGVAGQDPTTNQPGTQLILDLRTGKTVPLEGTNPCGGVNFPLFDWSADSRFVGAPEYCGIITEWDLSGRQVRHIRTGGQANVLDVSPDGSHMVVGSFSSSPKIYSMADGTLQTTLVGHQGGVTGVWYSADGKYIVSVGIDGTVRFWDPKTGTQVRLIELDPALTSVNLSFGPDSRTMAIWPLSLSGTATRVMLMPTCPACGDAAALLAEAAPRDTTELTALESAVLARYPS